MRRGRRIAVLTLVLCLMAFCAAAEHEVEYYYRNYCESCTPGEDFAEVFESLTGMPMTECTYQSYNVVTKAGKEALERKAEELGLENPSLPMVVVDGKAYQGDAQMQKELPEVSLAWTGTDSRIISFYTPACEKCETARKVFESLPKTVTIRRGEKEIESAVSVREIDASADPDLADRFFEAYNVPDEERVTPIVFLGAHYLSGADRIERDLASMVNLGWAASPLKVKETDGETEAAKREGSSALSISASIGAGLVGGLNPCAASMLLLFLALALGSGKQAGPMIIVFLGSKLLCYLLIGFFLLEMLQAFNPTWMLPVARWLMTGLGLVLILLNLWDAFQIGSGHWEKIRNQLPGGMRTRLRHLIERMMKTKRLWIPGIVLLGFLVAGGEFLCAGQLYLIRLLAAVRESRSQQMLGLIAYCLAFITPAAAASILMLRGMASEKVSGFVAKHMMAARIAAAAVILVMMILSWLTT